MIPSLKAGLLLAALGTALVISDPAAARPPEAEIVIDAATGEILHAANADTRTQPASLTKMMTLYMAFEALDRGEIRMDQFLPVSIRAANQSPSKLGLKPGSRIMLEDAVMGLVTRSANDAAVVIAEALGGTEEAFAERMTEKARQLGMNSTTFRNASGLPNAGQLTTARDMATLSQALIKNHPRRYQYFGRAQYVYEGKVIRSHNRLMSRYEGMDGIKTGFVNASGFNLAASARRDGRRLIGVVLGGTSARSRDNRMASLLDDAFGVEHAAPAATQVAALPEPAAAPRSRAQGDTAAIRTLKAPVKAPAARKTATASSASWMIQVGAFASTRQAQTNLGTIRKAVAGDVLGGAKPVVVKQRGKYLARYTGFDKDDAAAACKAIERKGHDCLVIKGS